MIQAEHLTKYYADRLAVDDLTFTIQPGAVVGFLGLNGAGKTTTLRMLAGDLAPSSGTIRIGDQDLAGEPRAVRRRIGFLPDTPPLYGEMTVRGYLLYAGQLRGLGGRALASRVDEVAETVRVGEVLGDLVSNLSHGYRQRVGIGQAIVHGPDFVILDEPISGLDPVQIADMRELIRSLAGRHTVLLSSHILTEISQTCDRILVMGDGGIVADGTEAELRGRFGADSIVRLTVRGNAKVLAKELEVHPAVRSVETRPTHEEGVVEIEVHATGDLREELARAVIESGFALRGLTRVERELESLFVELTARKPASRAPEVETEAEVEA